MRRFLVRQDLEKLGPSFVVLKEEVIRYLGPARVRIALHVQDLSVGFHHFLQPTLVGVLFKVDDAHVGFERNQRTLVDRVRFKESRALVGNNRIDHFEGLVECLVEWRDADDAIVLFSEQMRREEA